MSSLLYVLLIFAIYASGLVIGESQICGYSDESILCCSGYKKDDQGDCTLPICENDCGPGGQCIRPDTCYCSNGRVAYSCPDERNQDNEFGTRNREACADNCNGQGTCVRGKCECNRGYSGSSCLVKIVDTCYQSLSRGICQKSEIDLKLNIELCCGAFDVAWGDPCQKCPKSRCGKGFMEVDGTCQDVNECSFDGICRNGQCENLEGSYRCTCSLGYQFNPSKGDCVKTKDPCKQVPSVCGPGMVCTTVRTDKYVCSCRQGYVKSFDEKSCILRRRTEFNLCAVYGSYVCQYGKCVPDGNNYKCECNPGYRLSGDSKSCKKSIDYCSLYQSVLCPNGECISVNDDYRCKCNPGYTPSFNQKKCTSVCDLYPGSLCPNARCIPQPGGDYECQCNEGYSAIGKGKHCRRIMSDQSASLVNAGQNHDQQTQYDVDYCSYDYYRRQCEGGRCENKKGYYQCECPHGYVSDKNGLACKKIDSLGSGQMRDMAGTVELKSYCDRYGTYLCTNGHCQESGSSYQCRCNTGYNEAADGKSCYDIDECATDPRICVQGTCTNSPGSYQCSCYDGFTIHYVPGGPKCYDRNECDEDTSLCSNGQCINKWGSYKCSCNSGFIISSDGKQCVSVERNTDQNTEGSPRQCYNCVRSCKPINGTQYECECPRDLAPVLNIGLCAPMTQVVDIQFDIPSSERRVKRSISALKYIFFDLIPGANRDNFADKVSSSYRELIINQCIPSNRQGNEGILCSYYNSSRPH